MPRLHATRESIAMPKSTPRKSSRDKVRAHRERLRAQGLRPIQIWVPDVRSPEFAAEAHRQSLLVAQSEQEKDDLAFIESLFDLAQWDGKGGVARFGRWPVERVTLASRVPS